MTRLELLDWLAIDDGQLDKLLARGLPAEGHGQYSMNDVADWLNSHGLTESPSQEPVLPEGVVKTRREAAAALSRSVVAIDQWMAAGCPGEPGRYVIRDMQMWRDERDRQLKRPATYGTAAKGTTPADIGELRGLVRDKLLDHNGLIIAVLQASFDAIEAKLPEIGKDRKLKSELLLASFEAAMPFMVGKDELEPAIEQRVRSVLELVR